MDPNKEVEKILEKIESVMMVGDTCTKEEWAEFLEILRAEIDARLEAIEEEEAEYDSGKVIWQEGQKKE